MIAVLLSRTATASTARRFAARLLAFTALLPLLSACSSVTLKPDPARTGPFYAPANVRKVDRLPASVRRIALLPCASAGPRLTEDTLGQLDRTLATTFTATARAELVPVSRETLARLFGRPAYVSTDPLPHEFLNRVASLAGADAVAFVDITGYSPYPPLSVGLRARLVTPDGGALWHFDDLFTASEPAVVNAARAHVLGRTTTTGAPTDLSRTILQNPAAFSDYVATAVWNTLPPR